MVICASLAIALAVEAVSAEPLVPTSISPDLSDRGSAIPDSGMFLVDVSLERCRTLRNDTDQVTSAETCAAKEGVHGEIECDGDEGEGEQRREHRRSLYACVHLQHVEAEAR